VSYKQPHFYYCNTPTIMRWDNVYERIHIKKKKTYILICKKIKRKAIPVTGREGPSFSETSRLPHFLDNRLIDDSDVVSFRRRPPFTAQEDAWYSFLLEAELNPEP
jgi:hypothetical protein